MSLSIPCDACGKPVRDGLGNVRFEVSSVVPAGRGETRIMPVSRPSEFAFCETCGAYLDVGIADIVRAGRAPAQDGDAGRKSA